MKELDLGAVNDGKLAPGSWTLEVVAVKESTSQAGNDCLDIQFKEVNDEGRHFERIPLMENTLWKVKNLVAAAGLDAEAKWTVDDLKQDLVGACVVANIVTNTMPGSTEERQQAKTFSPVVATGKKK